MKYVYSAVFTEEKDGSGVSVVFPDFNNDNCKYGIATGGEDMAEAIDMAKDALCLALYEIEQNGDKLPKPSDIEVLRKDADGIVSLVNCDTDFYKEFFKDKSVRKNVTIPSNLNAMAVKAGINFSFVLQEALKQKLHLVDALVPGTES
jgi:predicted RNase H-like HicB family nuclease